MSNPTTPAERYQLGPGYNPVATEADVLACYRLLLGREPDPGGLESFNRLVRSRTTSVLAVVRTFLNSVEFTALHKPASAPGPAHLLELPDFRLYVGQNDWCIDYYKSPRGYEPHVAAVLRSTLKPGMHMVDIGANIGFFSMLAASLVGAEGKVSAFEPAPNNVVLLASSARLNGYDAIIDIWPLGLAERSRLLLLTQQGSNGYIQEYDGVPGSNENEFVVKCVALDSFARFDRLDFIKMDVEGAERMVMAGALELIRRFRPVVCSEFSPPMLERISRCSGTEYLEMWTAEGYEICIIEHETGPRKVGTNIAEVVDFFHRFGSTHIDLLFTPGR